MLEHVFLGCAAVGGALVVAQLLLSVVAFGLGHGVNLRHHGGPAPEFRGGMRGAGGAHRFRMHFPKGVRAVAKVGRGSPKPAAVHRAGAGRSGAGAKATAGTKAGGFVGGHALFAWVQSMFNLQGILAGATVFGLVGLAAISGKLTPRTSVAIAIASALVMMALIERLFDLMGNMDTDGTVEIQQAVGQPATVYLGIPAKNQGQGKVTMSLQERLMEFSAVTFGDAPLARGDKVTVVNILDPSVMVVVPESQ